jgi:hypothetical protein
VIAIEANDTTNAIVHCTTLRDIETGDPRDLVPERTHGRGVSQQRRFHPSQARLELG